MTTTEVISTAIIMGSIGSLHCVGMCGPLALAIPMGHRDNWGRVAGGALYNFGRITTYTLMGLLLGTVGEFLFSPQLQSALSIVFGALILLFLLLPTKIKTTSSITAIAYKPFIKLRSALSKFLYIKSYSSVFGFGMLNGLLPCGMVYIAITSSFLTGSALQGGLFMAFFGLGTFPAMLAAVFFGSYMNQKLRFRLRKVVPVFLLFMAAFLIMRGMNLGIPYISPVLPAASQPVGMGCH